VLLHEVPAAWPHHEDGGSFIERVALALRACEADRAPDSIAQVHLAFDHVLPRRRVGVLEVGHEHVRAAVERVDHHLAVGRAGELDPAVLQVARNRADGPVRFADAAGLGQEVGKPSGVELGLAAGAQRQQLAPPAFELARELGNESERLRTEDLAVALGHSAAEGDAVCCS